ncbi:hydrogenase nickel incorporation protein HypB [Thalassobacillus devorans]|uniref:hydrogenase nickel incorporation protein HypB n=1 Tax=Thalassobacillus devorans TaxID=279813 RepID=UPI0020CAA46B|nr:hydrogenase nickel incorporation protein HypB [Thalassobacillus devorans]
MKRDVLLANKKFAAQNRTVFYDENVFVINLLSDAYSGKTTILKRTIEQLKDVMTFGVIEAVKAASTERISIQNVQSVQINTQGACQLDAKMIAEVLPHFTLREIDMLVIENVGTLNDPEPFDLGEHVNAAVISTVESAEKVIKHPTPFEHADVILLTKMDIFPYTGFDLKEFRENVKQINPDAPVFELSAQSGEGFKRWTKWLKESWVAQTQVKDFDWT